MHFYHTFCKFKLYINIRVIFEKHFEIIFQLISYLYTY